MKLLRLPILLALLALAMAGPACDRKPSSSATANGGQSSAGPRADELELVLAYGSEKKAWINEATDAFNASGQKAPNGKTIRVKAIAMGSGESKDDILEGRLQAHLWSPASNIFVSMGNAQSATKGGPLVERTEELVLSPVVIAMWKPMAEALGWPNKPVGWADVLSLAKDPKGWEKLGRPAWGRMRFGHTHPDFSNSGLISVLAEAYAASGKTRGLTLDDVSKPEVAAFVRDIETAVVHYGKSTGFFGDALAKGGPSYLSAAVLYENMVIEANTTGGLEMPLVSIYPKEGTFWSDHPVGIVSRPWVTEDHKAAARLYIDHLLSPAWQAKALTYGFRPAKGDLGSPIDVAHGADPQQPKTILETPSAPVVDAILSLWRANKKPADIVLVFDKSGSMNEQQKMMHAKSGARDLIGLLDDRDSLSMVPFSSDVIYIPGGPLAQQRGALLSNVDDLVADGSTRLYAGIERAYDELSAKRASLKADAASRIAAIVVLTDGEDNDRQYNVDRLIAKLRGGSEGDSIRVFTIGYGDGVRMDVLKKIAAETRGQAYVGKVKDIREVFRDIASFF